MNLKRFEEYKIFCDERVFIITADEEKCFRSENGVGTRITEANQVNELFDLFEKSKIAELYVCSETPEREMQCLAATNRRIDAAGGLVFDGNNNLLLIRRLGYWDLPKGKIEKDETEISAARREIEEECGITDVEIIKKITETYHTYKIQEDRIIKRTAWFEARYNGRQTPSPQTEEGITEVIWVPYASICNYLPEMYASLRTIFQDEM